MFVYHEISEDFIGDTLYPLNTLKNIYPDVYTREVKKYTGRKEIQNKKIPSLNCTWLDVIHFSCVDPKIIFDELVHIGFDYQMDEYIQLNANELDVNKWVVFQDNVYDGGVFFDSLDAVDCSTLPVETIEYYKECYKENKHPLIFAGIPHLLY